VISIGAVLALEVEQEMYCKYVTSVPGAVKKEYNKKDYRQHYLMIMRNLKQKHNDPLVSGERQSGEKEEEERRGGEGIEGEERREDSVDSGLVQSSLAHCYVMECKLST
jgi:hypothetical protein